MRLSTSRAIAVKPTLASLVRWRVRRCGCGEIVRQPSASTKRSEWRYSTAQQSGGLVAPRRKRWASSFPRAAHRAHVFDTVTLPNAYDVPASSDSAPPLGHSWVNLASNGSRRFVDTPVE